MSVEPIFKEEKMADFLKCLLALGALGVSLYWFNHAFRHPGLSDLERVAVIVRDLRQ